MSGFTKGEWFAKREGQSTVYIECRIGGGWLQEVAACGPTANGSEEQEANAKLIAAAPDLLEALINLKREIVLSDISNESIEKMYPFIVDARKAIAKALASNS